MPLSAGDRLGPYEILAPIGAGGMGEVYQARDTRLNRSVAIKVLAGGLSDNPEHRERFEREARAVAALNHPNICTLHDVGAEDGAIFLVMERLVGETLAARLAKGPLPLEQTLAIATEIADALAAAHRQGIIHRDIKPGNVMLTRTGAKLLDFGLAKLRRGEGGSSAAPLPSMTTELLTGPGLVLGTVPYMAPEQLERNEADARSDVFSFGAVLYEMLTGERAFPGESPASIVAAILTRDPAPVSSVMPGTPPSVERLVHRCLAKVPDDRWQSVSDLADELRWLSEPINRTAVAQEGPRRLGVVLPAAALACLAAGFLIGWLVGPSRATGGAGEYARLPLTVSLTLPGTLSLTNTIALAPDGRRLAITATDDPKKPGGIWLQDLATSEMKRLDGTEGAVDPFWSPDSQSIGFFANGSLKRVPASGGPPQTLTPVEDSRGGTWNPNGAIVYGQGAKGPLFRIPAEGGRPSPLTALDVNEGEISLRFPEFLPDGRHLLLLASRRNQPTYCVAQSSLDQPGPARCLAVGLSTGMYVGGRLFYVRGRTLVSSEFDAASGRLSGEPVPAVEPVWREPGTYGRQGCTASARMIACRHGTPSRVAWTDASGRTFGFAGPDESANPVFSPDGRRLAVTATDWDTMTDGLWIVDEAAPWRMTRKELNVEAEAWSPDGRQLVFGLETDHSFDLFVQDVERGSVERKLFSSPDFEVPTDWSSDGRWILFDRAGDIWRISDQGGEPVPVIRTGANELNGRFSPDMRWIAYESDESSKREIYLVPFGRQGDPVAVTTGGGREPQWRADGKAIFYVGGDGSLKSVDIDTRLPSPIIGSPRLVRPAGSLPNLAFEWTYAVPLKGDRFVVNTVPDQVLSNRISLLVDWRPRTNRR